MSDVREIELAVEHFASNQEFIRLYNRHNRELLLQHFLLIAAAGNDVWTTNQERKMSMPEQRDLMLVKYMEWLEKLHIEFPEVEKPFDVSEDWWRLMLLAYERKPISGKSLWRKFKEDTRNPILSSFNCHWVEPRDGETLEDRFRIVRRGVWNDLGHRDDEFLQEGSWLPKQWYAWRYCCYPGKVLRAFDGKLPSVPQRQRNQLARNHSNNNNDLGWAAALPIDASLLEASMSSTSTSAALPVHNQHNVHNLHNQLRPSTTNNNSVLRTNRSTLPTTVANQRLLQAAASMSRVRANPEDELNVQHYLADVQQYMAQMTRLEKAAALAETFGETDKALGFKRQLYEHVQTEPPGRLKRANSSIGGSGNSGGSSGSGVHGAVHTHHTHSTHHTHTTHSNSSASAHGHNTNNTNHTNNTSHSNNTNNTNTSSGHSVVHSQNMPTLVQLHTNSSNNSGNNSNNSNSNSGNNGISSNGNGNTSDSSQSDASLSMNQH